MPRHGAEGRGHGVVKKSTCDYKKISTILLEKFFVSGGVLVGIVAEKYREVYNSRHKA